MLKSLTLPDIVLIISVLIAGGALFYHQLKNKSDAVVSIYVNGNPIIESPLNQDRTININEHCQAEIKDKAVRMIKADCADRRCIKQGWTTVNPIICLPNKVVIEIANRKSDNKIHLLY